MNLKISTFFLLLFLVLSASAKKTDKICADYTYTVHQNETQEQAKHIALQRAQLEGLAEYYGYHIMSTNILTKIEGDIKSEENFYRQINQEVKGEWIENIGKVEYKYSFDDKNNQVIQVHSCFKARAINKNTADIVVKTLRNGTEAKFENEQFKNGDDLYLLFQSPKSGYLAIYLADVMTKTAYCLLPYKGNKTGQHYIQNNKEYIFFSSKHADKNDADLVDELVLTAENAVERNEIYIIFSPKAFTKASDKSTEENLPRELSFAKFTKWLNTNKLKDTELQSLIKTIEIRP
ncbi:MAG: DUF4384 domain-containing protein [Bacteroidales bacterium]